MAYKPTGTYSGPVGVFKRDKGGWGRIDKSGKRYDMPSHWRFNKKKHSEIKNPFKAAQRSWWKQGGGTTGGNTPPDTTGGGGMPPGTVIMDGGDAFGQTGMTPPAISPDQTAAAWSAAYQLKQGLMPIKQQLSELRAGNFQKLHSQYKLNEATARQGRGVLGAQLSGDRGLTSVGGARRMGFDQIRDQWATANREAQQSMGRPAVNRLKEQAASQVKDFSQMLLQMLNPESAERLRKELGI